MVLPLDLKIHDDLYFEIDDVEYLNMELSLVHVFEQINDLRVEPNFHAIDWTERYRTALSSYPGHKAQMMLYEYYNYARRQTIRDDGDAAAATTNASSTTTCRTTSEEALFFYTL